MSNLNPCFMKEIVQLSEANRRNAQKLNLKTSRANQAFFGSNSFKSFGHELWNLLCYHLNTLKNLITFKEIIKSWNGVS